MAPQFEISVFESESPLAKSFWLDQSGELKKEDGGQLTKGYVARRSFSYMSEFADFLLTLNGTHALAYGVSEHQEARVLSKKSKDSEKGGDRPIITRTREDFSWPKGEGIFLIDYDPPKDRPGLRREEVYQAIIDACPGLEDAPAILWHSASSFLYHGDKQLKGEGGYRIYIRVKDASDIPRSGKVLFKRLWLSGHGYIRITENGGLVERAPVDAAVWQPERLDFAGGASCTPPIVQRRPAPVVLNDDFDSEAVDTRVAVPDLTEEEEAEYNGLVRAAKGRKKPQAKEIRKKWLENYLAHLSEEKREEIQTALDTHVLLPDFPLILSEDDSVVTVREVLANKEKYHKVFVRHPLEPDHQKTNLKVAQINTDGEPNVFTFARHGQTFFLKAQSPEEVFEDIECPEPELTDIERLNKEFAVAVIGSKTLILREEEDEVSFLRKHDFETLLQNQKVWIEAGEKTKAVALSKIWLESPERRHVKGICFSPKGCKDGWINLWRGFAIKPAEITPEQAAENCSLYRQHVEQVICGGNEEHAKYLWAWLADLVQNPGGRKPGVAIVLRGGRGTGKGMFTRPFSTIFGRHSIQLNNRQHLVGQFNSHLADKIFVFMDEAFWAGEKAKEGILKGFITEPRITIEKKGVDAFEVDSYVRCVIASNETWVVPSGNDERRYLVLDVADTHKQDSSGYFKDLVAEMDNGGIPALLTWLLAYDGSDVDLFKAPESGARIDQKIESLNAVQAWWYECLSRGTVYDVGGWPEFVSTRVAFEDFRGWGRSWPGKIRATLTYFSRQVFGKKGLCPGKKTTRVIDDEKKPENVYALVPLNIARKQFEDFLGGPCKWPDEDDEEL
jgi:mRNA-degrading endonuclease toxin of MazEF toxin-antitoxin module